MAEYIIPGQAMSFYQIGWRDEQQDARFPDDDFPPEGSRTFIVCDGVGGQEGGAIASSTVCRAFADFMGGYANPAYEFTQSDFRQAITFAYQRLLKAIAQCNETDMATTLTFLHINADNALVAHMGDSRVYHIRPGAGILYRSTDHSLVNVLVHSGRISPEQAINHPEGNVITRSMSYAEPGAEPSAADVIVLTDIEAGDYFMLCTDGVISQIDDQYLVDLLSSSASDEDKMRNLAQICRNASDNNTATLVRIQDAPRVASAAGDTMANEEIEAVKPSIPSATPSQTCLLDAPAPEMERVAPDNALPLHRKVAGRLRDLFT
ncbi:MAG: protein phosphatase 2C domain-containing protein [Muribaculaceae bacterium]|nr:protein phosphatase 2C domain-containing protein [Muribaculaceae bacterium]